MKVSLILATLNRYDELKIFLDSLKKQTYKNFELIIVDQNKDNLIDDLLEQYKNEFSINHIKSNVLGLSYNRNKGLVYAKGEIIAFPDDDCEYEISTIERAVNYLYNRPKTIYTCRTLEKGENYGTGNMLEEDADLTFDNIEETVKSITFFVNTKDDDIYLFDIKLGVGAKYGSGEETDYVLNLLHKDYTGKYFSKHIVYHPAKKGNYEDIDRAYNYALGYGALCKKEIVHRKNQFYLHKFLKKVFRNIVAMIITKNRKYHYYVLCGRIKGFFNYD